MSVRTIVLLLVMLLAVPAVVPAADPAEPAPNWSLEFKGGYFYPDIDNWKAYYGDDKTWHYAGSLAYKVVRQVEVGIEGGYIKDRGLASAPLNSALFGGTVLTGRVDYELAPLNVFVLFRGVFKETQWVVPYAGGGWTRMYYRVKTEDQETTRGSADGYHGRAGLQFLLDGLDPRAAHNLSSDFGIEHTYLFGEVQVTKATVGTPEVNLGGTSYLMGFLFEF
jgi:hypothetical protein